MAISWSILYHLASMSFVNNVVSKPFEILWLLIGYSLVCTINMDEFENISVLERKIQIPKNLPWVNASFWYLVV